MGICLFHLVSRLSYYTGIAASFAVKLFKAWIAEKDANALTSALRKASLDKKLLVCLCVENRLRFNNR